MNEEIWFKGRRKNWKELGKEKWWVEGYYVKYGSRNFIYTGETQYSISPYMIVLPVKYEVNQGTVCQYKGLNDKSGKKIFEGDICKYYNSEDKDGIAIIREDYAEWIGGTIRKKEIETPLFYLQCDKEWEIIGNIFENHELLEAVK